MMDLNKIVKDFYREANLCDCAGLYSEQAVELCARVRAEALEEAALKLEVSVGIDYRPPAIVRALKAPGGK